MNFYNKVKFESLYCSDESINERVGKQYPMEFEVIDTRVGQFDQVKTVISSLDLNQLCKIEFKLEFFKHQIDH